MNDLAVFESNVNQKINSFEGKLGICQEMMKGIATLIKMKKSVKNIQKSSRKKSFFSESPERERPVSKIIQDYEDKI